MVSILQYDKERAAVVWEGDDEHIVKHVLSSIVFISTVLQFMWYALNVVELSSRCMHITRAWYHVLQVLLS